ncbi:hypothetical protein CYMTET_37711 [Cymbomonas tetramitiformis]|uniref:Uncharacterized protein n=1 Tax=Cymbomonas tetramitiformis TaxID=36881 RepID=A0AAE0CEQ9_9CHLO|nr:hypothetical protein CYMTET_37711 [Cymbomonas tetramitiformis]
MSNAYAWYFLTLTTGFTLGSLWSFGLYLFATIVQVDIATDVNRTVKRDVLFQDFNQDHLRQHFINLTMYVMNGLSNALKYASDLVAACVNAMVTYRYFLLIAMLVTVAAFVLAFEGHTLVSKTNVAYDELHRPIFYPLKMYLRFLATLYSAFAGAFNVVVLAGKRAFSILRDTVLRLTADVLLELVFAWSAFLSHLGQEIYDWVVKQHFVDASPDFLHSCLALQRGMWAVRESVIVPCGFARLFWETLGSPLDYYPPAAHSPVQLADYYAPSAHAAAETPTFNKFCYRQKLYDPTMVVDAYEANVRYCRVCDFDSDVRSDCLPYNYHAPLALNAIVASVCMMIKVPAQYILRTGGVRVDANDDASAGGDDGDALMAGELTSDARDSEGGYGAFGTFDGSERKYSVCWNGYTGSDGEYPYGVPAEPYLHHPPWLLCMDYAEYYRTFDFDGVITLMADAVGFTADSLDRWYMGCFNYMQYAMAHAVDLDDAGVCENLFSVHPPTWDKKRKRCVATPPSVALAVRASAQAVIGGVRIGARLLAYLPVIVYELRDRWEQFFVDASEDATQIRRARDREGLVHQLLETPNTQGCRRSDSVYPETSTGGTENVDVTVLNYCARNYVIDQMSLPALVVPPANPSYPAPPPAPTPPPSPPPCKIPIVRTTGDTDNTTTVHLGLDAWVAYGCGVGISAVYREFIKSHAAEGYAVHKIGAHRSAYGTDPQDLTVNCSFLDAYGDYSALLPPDECANRYEDGECVISGHPAYGDMSNVDTTDLRTSPNVYLFDDTEQEQCTCDSDGSFSDATPTYYNCPTAAQYDSRTITFGTGRSGVRSYLADVDGATLEGAGDVRYPVCRVLQVAILDGDATTDAELTYAYGMPHRERCRMTEAQYSDGLVSSGYGVQAECALVAVTDIAKDEDRQAATFLLEDPARVMRFPVRIVEREVVEGQARPKDLIGASPEWTARYTEQVFAGYNVTEKPQPDWRAYETIGGTYGAMHQPLCSCDPHEFVSPTPLHKVRRCMPRTLVGAPASPPPLSEPPGPPPDAPSNPPMTSATVCRDAYGSVLRGYRMQHNPQNIYPSECVCADTDRKPISTISGQKDAEVMYCPTTCVGDAIVDGPSCVCRARDADDLRATANGGPSINNTANASQVQTAVDDAADALSVDVASTDVTSSLYKYEYEYEYAYSFNFDDVDARFPTKTRAQTVCKDTLGSGWSLHAPVAGETEMYRSMLQTALNVHINDRTSSGVGSPIMDTHPLCARVYRVQLPPRMRARHGADPSTKEKRAALNPARTLQRIAAPLGTGPYSVSDQTYIREALLAELQALLPNTVTYKGLTDTACVSSDSLNGLGVQTTRLSALFDGAVFKDYDPEQHCVDTQYYQITGGGTAVACADPLSSDADGLPFSAGDGMHLRAKANSKTAVLNATGPDDNAKVGMFINVSMSGRSLLLDHRYGAVTVNSATPRQCALPVVNEREAETDYCGMYVDLTHRSARVADTNVPKSRYTYGKPLLPRRTIKPGITDCAPTDAASDLVELCIDANLLNPEEMGQAATFCGVSVVEAALRASRARSGCAAVPHGFLFDSGVVPIVYRTEPRHNRSYLSYNSVLDGLDAAVPKSSLFQSHFGLADQTDTTQYVAVCSRQVPTSIVRKSVKSDGDLADGTRDLAGTHLNAAREALQELQKFGTKCALNLEGVTFPMGVAPPEAARPNAAERLAASRKRWFPYPWTRRGGAAASGPVRFTLGTVLEMPTAWSTDQFTPYVQLNTFGRTRAAVNISGRGHTAVLRITARVTAGLRGNALGDRRTDPVTYGGTHPEFDLPTNDAFAAAGGGALSAGQVLVADFCNASLLGAARRKLRIRSAFDNRFLQAKGVGPHPAMPSWELRSVGAQYPSMSRTSSRAANPSHDAERYLQGQFTNNSGDETISSHVYMLYGGDPERETLRTGAYDTHDATGYLFEGDFRLTTGARADVGVSGDVDPDGGVGLHGRFQGNGDDAQAPLRDRGSPNVRDSFERGTQRMAFVAVEDANDVRLACTRVHDASARARATVGAPTTTQDGRVDDGDCDESKRAVYSNWGEGQPIASSQDDTTDLASALFEASVHDCVALNVLAGSRCALLVGDDGDDARSAACAIGMRVVFGEWSALPCGHVKPYACADAEGNNLQIETEPVTFDEARTRCAAMGMILAPPPGDAIANRNLAVQAHAQLCDAHVLQPYSSSACDSTTSPEIRRAVPSWSNSLPGGVQVGESGYANCTEPGAFVRVKLELQHNLAAPTYVLDLSPDACDADSHPHAGVYRREANPYRSYGESSELAASILMQKGQNDYNLVYGDVWIGLRRPRGFAGFKDQRYGACDNTDDGMANTSAFEVVPCKTDSDARIGNEYAIVGADETGRAMVVVTQQVKHPFDSGDHAESNAIAFLKVMKDLGAWTSTEPTQADMLDAEQRDGYLDEEHVLNTRNWLAHATTLKLAEDREAVHLSDARAGRCVRGAGSKATHALQVVVCTNAVERCESVVMHTSMVTSTAHVLLPVDGETESEFAERMQPDLVYDRPKMTMHRASDPAYSKPLWQRADAVAMTNVNGNISSETVFTRDADGVLSGETSAFNSTSGYHTRDALQSANPPGVSLSHLGATHAGFDATTVLAGGHGGLHYGTYLRALNESTYPCQNLNAGTEVFPYSDKLCDTKGRPSAPNIGRVIAPSSCGVQSDDETDDACMLPAMLTGRRLGMVAGVHATPKDAARRVRLRRLDAAWPHDEVDSDGDTITYPAPDMMRESYDDYVAEELARTSNRTALWYPIDEHVRDDMVAQRQESKVDQKSHTNGWLYTCAGETLAFEPSIELDNPPTPPAPEAPPANHKISTNVARFQVTAGGELLTVNDLHESVSIREDANAYVASQTNGDIEMREQAHDFQNAIPLSAYNTYGFTGPNALAATVAYGNTALRNRTAWLCDHVQSQECEKMKSAMEDVRNVEDVKSSYNILHGGNAQKNFIEDFDLHYVSGPQIQLPDAYTGAFGTVPSDDQSIYTKWSYGYSGATTGVCNRAVGDDWKNAKCKTEFQGSPESNADGACHLPEQASSKFTTTGDGCVDKKLTCLEDLLAVNSVRSKICSDRNCDRTCGLCDEQTPYDGSSRWRSNFASRTYTSDEERGRSICTCEGTFPDGECISVDTTRLESTTTANVEVVESPEMRFMTAFYDMWDETVPVRQGERKVVPIVDMWNDDGAHGGFRYDTAFAWRQSNHDDAQSSGWRQDPGNRGPARVLVLLPTNNEDGDLVDVTTPGKTERARKTTTSDTMPEQYTKSAKRAYGVDMEELDDFNNKETFKRVSDLVAGLCDDFTRQHRKYDAPIMQPITRSKFLLDYSKLVDTKTGTAYVYTFGNPPTDGPTITGTPVTYFAARQVDATYAQPCLGFASQDMYVYDGHPYDKTPLDACIDSKTKCGSQELYEMQTNRFYPSYASWSYYQAKGDSDSDAHRGYSAARDGLGYVLNRTAVGSPHGTYSPYRFDTAKQHKSSSDELYVQPTDNSFVNDAVVQDEADLRGKKAIRAFIFTLYGAQRYAAKNTGVDRRRVYDALHTTKAPPFAWKYDDDIKARSARSGAPRRDDRFDLKKVPYAGFTPAGRTGGAKANASSADHVHTRHSGHLYATHTAMDLRRRHYYPAFYYRTINSGDLGELGMSNARTAAYGVSNAAPIEILWPPPEVTLWSRVAETPRMRASGDEVFGSGFTPTDTFYERNGVNRVLQGAPTDHKRAGMGSADSADGVRDGGLGMGSAVTAKDTTGVYLDVPPDFGFLWNRYLRNRIPTCYRVHDGPHQNYYSRKTPDDDSPCDQLKPVFGDTTIGPDRPNDLASLAPPPMPPFPNGPPPSSYAHVTHEHATASSTYRNSTYATESHKVLRAFIQSNDVQYEYHLNLAACNDVTHNTTCDHAGYGCRVGADWRDVLDDPDNACYRDDLAVLCRTRCDDTEWCRTFQMALYRNIQVH